MVFIQLPTELTEEEEMLKRKYQKLKKKVISFYLVQMLIVFVFRKRHFSN